MVEEFNIFETNITIFEILNWALSISSTLWVFYVYFKKRYLFIKPSILLLCYSIIFFSWPATVLAGYYEEFLPDPYVFAALIHGYVLFGLLISTHTLHESSRVVWSRVTGGGLLDLKFDTRVIFLLAGMVVVTIAAYLSYHPFSATGLYAIFINPAASAMAREESLKLLESKTIKYTYSLMSSSVAPLLAVMLSFIFLKSIKEARFGVSAVSCLLIAGLFFTVSLTGARVPSVNLLMAMAIAVIFRAGIPFKPAKFILVGALILSPAILISIFREGRGVGFSIYVEFFRYVVNRVFVIPLDVGSWYVHYTQTEGFFGIAGIEKLALFLGIDTFDIPNFIGVRYAEEGLSTISATSGYLFSYYSFFGLPSILLSLAGLFMLDVAVYVYRRLTPYVLLPCISAVSLSTLAFISSNYTTVWLTHGFGVILVLSLAVNWFAGKRFVLFKTDRRNTSVGVAPSEGVTQMGKRVCHMSSAHQLPDVRIFHKECKTLKEAGYDVYFVVTAEEDGEADGVKVRALPAPKNRFERMLKNTFLAFARALRTKADVYHFHDPELIPAGVFLKILGKKVIYDVHEDVPKQILNKEWIGSGPARGLVASLFNIIERTGIFFFDGIVAATDEIAKKFGPEKTIAIRNFPIVKLFDAIKPVDMEKSAPVIIYTGALTRLRGIREVVRAMSFLEGRAILWLLGQWESDSFRKECEAEAGWKHVRYLGFKKLEEAYGYTKAADIGIVNFHPIENHMKAMPNKAFEYMACSLPMVMSDFPYWRGMFKECALLADPLEPEGIAEKITALLEDKALRETLGRKGRESIEEKYSWEAESRRLIAFYEGLI